jgi:hypothetical protein
MSASGNDALRDEIVKHCLGRLGLSDILSISPIFNLASPEYLLDKRIAFADEDRQYSNKVFAAEETIDSSRVQILLADTGDIETVEWTSVFRLNDARPIAFKWSKDKETSEIYTVASFEQNETWYAAGILFLAKILNGFENLNARSVVLRWKKSADYIDIYQSLIDFLKS